MVNILGLQVSTTVLAAVAGVTVVGGLVFRNEILNTLRNLGVPIPTNTIPVTQMAISNARPGFSQAWTFNQGQNSNSNMQWPNMNSIGALSNYVDASYPDINSIPFSGNASVAGKDAALNQTLPYLQWRGMAAKQETKFDVSGQSNGGNDNGYYAHNNPFQGQALASFNRMSTSE